MPELPEVETRLLFFKRTALGQTIRRVRVYAPGNIKTPSAREFARKLQGRRIVDGYRRGKYLIASLDDGRALILHFGMGGDLCYYGIASERPGYTRIEFLFESEWRLAFTCPRNICRVMLVDDPSLVRGIREMGPEPLGREFTVSRLRGILTKSPSRRIKPLLLDQSSIAGIGNIYADEILYAAGIRPDTRVSAIGARGITGLHGAIRRVLKESLRTAHEEDFPDHFLIGREGRGLGCPRCGHAIEKKRIGGRTSRFCPACQSRVNINRPF